MEKMKCVCIDGERFISENEMIDNVVEWIAENGNAEYSVCDGEATEDMVANIECFLDWMDETSELKRMFQEEYVKCRFRNWLKN